MEGDGGYFHSLMGLTMVILLQTVREGSKEKDSFLLVVNSDFQTFHHSRKRLL